MPALERLIIPSQNNGVRMNKEALDERKKVIDESIAVKQQQINQSMADLNVLNGHLIEVNHWLLQLEKHDEMLSEVKEDELEDDENSCRGCT